MNRTLVIIGGGAAGFFGAIHAAEENLTDKVILLEKTNQLLSKVKISGGGRCNVTHACFSKEKLVTNYPRGNPELLGPLSRFSPTETIDWFKKRAVALKVESDGRMFPETNSSETIVNCLLGEAKRLNIEIRQQQRITQIEKMESGFCIHLEKGPSVQCQKILMATGSSKEGYALARSFGHTIIDPVPSLFTFHVPTSPLLDLSGISIQDAKLSLAGTSFYSQGPLLITHFGFSGPAVLRLSAFAARFFHEKGYRALLHVDWIANIKGPENQLEVFRKDHMKVALGSLNPFGFSKSLWKRFLERADLDSAKSYQQLSHQAQSHLVSLLKDDAFLIDGKSPFKEEFVTAGGILLKEIHFKTMESRLTSGLHFAGEILDIDGVTGGFNFQNAWTSGYLAGKAMAHPNL